MHIMYIRHYLPINDYPYNEFKNLAVNPSLIYNSGFNFASANLQRGVNTFWISDSPINLCESYEMYDAETMKCAVQNKALMFIRKATHAITIQTSGIRIVFTVEFWIKIARTEDSFQELFRTLCFAIKYEDHRFIATFFNNTILEDKGYTAVSGKRYLVDEWIHVAVSNVNYLNKSSLCINGVDVADSFFIIPRGNINSWIISNDTHGFTGMFRELRLWNGYRSPGRIHHDMHIWQGDHSGYNFHLVSYFPLNEAHGYFLYDHASYNPRNQLSYEAFIPGLISPYWATAENLPVLCSYNHKYNTETKTCTFGKKILNVISTLTLESKRPFAFKEWSFHTWVKYKGGTQLKVEKLFTATASLSTVSRVSLEINLIGVEGTPPPSFTIENEIDIDTWYHFSIGHFYGERRIILQHKKASAYQSPIVSRPTVQLGTLPFSYYGPVKIELKEGYFMHLSFWKKYLGLEIVLIPPIDVSQTHEHHQYIDPYCYC